MTTKDIGDIGEKASAKYLKKNGYKMVDATDVFVFHYWHKSVKTKQFDKKYKNIRTVITTHQKKYSIPKSYNY